jgi:hypothetical protein
MGDGRGPVMSTPLGQAVDILVAGVGGAGATPELSVTANTTAEAGDGVIVLMVHSSASVVEFGVSAPGFTFTQLDDRWFPTRRIRAAIFTTYGPMPAGTPITVTREDSTAPVNFQFRAISLPGAFSPVNGVAAGDGDDAQFNVTLDGLPETPVSVLALWSGGTSISAWTPPFAPVGVSQAGNGVGASWAAWATSNGETITAGAQYLSPNLWTLQLAAFAPATLAVAGGRWMPTALQGQEWAGTLSATGGKPPYRWQADGLPTALSASPEGTLSGIAGEAGRWPVDLTVTDADGRQASHVADLIVYAPAGEPLPPWQPAPAGSPARQYDLIFNRRYLPIFVPPPEPPPRPPGVPEFVLIRWDGMDLQVSEGEGDNWFTGIVTLVTGWYASPPLDGNNAARALSDGAIRGHKLLGAREIAITGAAAGPRARLMQWRDLLAHRAADRMPVELEIGDPQLGHTLTATVRADTESFRHEFFAGPLAFRYEVTLTATDPLLYGQEWHQAVLSTETAADAGRRYDPPPRWPRRYDAPPQWATDKGIETGWGYGQPYAPGSAAFLTNAGNAEAPVYATYEGDLDQSELTDERASIWLAPVGDGVTINVATATLVAEAPGGAPRAEWIQPGSRPMVIPGFTTARWHLYSQGSGRVILMWRSAWT